MAESARSRLDPIEPRPVREGACPPSEMYVFPGIFQGAGKSKRGCVRNLTLPKLQGPARAGTLTVKIIAASDLSVPGNGAMEGVGPKSVPAFWGERVGRCK